ncbi:MAG: hypothetical protein IJF04_05695, partial [Oscillospiraceae bacterium]|nr:hypothetical protein [Oscillospiraceae bacterium]
EGRVCPSGSWLSLIHRRKRRSSFPQGKVKKRADNIRPYILQSLSIINCQFKTPFSSFFVTPFLFSTLH